MSARAAGDGKVSRRRRSAQLLDIALELIVEQGYGGLSMAAVARAAGVSKPIVYRSYPNRAALIGALLRREQKRTDRTLDAAIPRDPGDRHPRELLVGVTDEILAAVESDPLTWRLVLLPPEGTPRFVRELVERRREQLVRRARRLVSWGVPYLGTDEDLDLDLLARALVAIVESQARTLLADPESGRAPMVRSIDALIGAVEWRAEPRAS